VVFWVVPRPAGVWGGGGGVGGGGGKTFKQMWCTEGHRFTTTEGPTSGGYPTRSVPDEIVAFLNAFETSLSESHLQGPMNLAWAIL